MIVLSIAAAILAIGVPSFRDFHRNNRLVVAANDVLGGVITSRAEALRRQTTISMCTSADPGAAKPACGTGSGWILFVDTDEDCERAETEEVVKVVTVDTDVNAATNGDCLSFASTGFRRVVGGEPTNQHMLYCDDRKNSPRAKGSDNSTARGVEVMPTGRGAVITSVDQIESWADGDAGVECP